MEKLTCSQCTKIFEKETKEVRRQTRKGRTQFYCSLSCSCRAGNVKTPRKGSIANFGGKVGVPRDELSPFRWFTARIRYRDVNHATGREWANTDLDAQYLKEVWDTQGGRCLFTNWQLELPHGTIGWDGPQHGARASLDRIDNSKPYVRGNVRFVSVIANYARNKFSDKELIDFCKAVATK